MIARMKAVVLKKGKEHAIANRHPWIFSGAIQTIDDDIPDGSIAPIRDYGGKVLAWGYVNRASDITVRIMSFGEIPFTSDSLRIALQSAIEKRKRDPFLCGINARRLVHSEGDGIPGLIVDKYDEHLVIQCLTLGIDRLRDEIAQMLNDLTHAKSIFERSDHAGRAAEGLKKRKVQISGSTPDEIIINENSMRFFVDVKKGQKTGFFLDQRENRAMLRRISEGRRILNLFAYTGGFTIAGFFGNAREIVSLDISQNALDLLKKNLALNCIAQPSEEICADAFDFLRHCDDGFDLIVLDPPAFIKSRADIADGIRGYRELHLQAFRICLPRSHVFSFSCSRFISMEEYQKVIFSAAAKTRRNVCILGKFHQPSDHPVNIFAPETEYLKGILFFVE